MAGEATTIQVAAALFEGARRSEGGGPGEDLDSATAADAFAAARLAQGQAGDAGCIQQGGGRVCVWGVAGDACDGDHDVAFASFEHDLGHRFAG